MDNTQTSQSRDIKIPWARAICYSGYREYQDPNKQIYPSKSQIKEDLEILIKHGFSYIRMYDAVIYAEMVCQVIQENNFPLKMMLGPGLISEVNNPNCPWNNTVYSNEELEKRALLNDKRIESLIKIANSYPEIIFAVSIGNENTPTWGENTVSEERLIEFAKRLKKETGKIVTFNEGAKEWKRLQNLAEFMDVICIHSYPLWYGLSLKEAITANKQDFEEIKALYPNKQVLFSELGWATLCLENTEMQTKEVNEVNQKQYYQDLWDWTDKEKIIAFVFEAFDEPWKGSSNPNEVEKHWGLYYENRTPKMIYR
jgi:exo-beta-1,3-glucanase (GH17 family)